ncbi:MAG: hypothetical protein QXZ20_00790 [Candidatus Aenigmatarchaeota archaeon]
MIFGKKLTRREFLVLSGKYILVGLLLFSIKQIKFTLYSYFKDLEFFIPYKSFKKSTLYSKHQLAG